MSTSNKPNTYIKITPSEMMALNNRITGKFSSSISKTTETTDEN